MTRMPASPTAQVRASLRHFDVDQGARLWDLTARDALRVAAGLPVRPEVIAKVLARAAALGSAAAGVPPRRRRA